MKKILLLAVLLFFILLLLLPIHAVYWIDSDGKIRDNNGDYVYNCYYSYETGDPYGCQFEDE